jgi:hypothetical protein
MATYKRVAKNMYELKALHPSAAISCTTANLPLCHRLVLISGTPLVANSTCFSQSQNAPRRESPRAKSAGMYGVLHCTERQYQRRK